jgi:hypothetical protein
MQALSVKRELDSIFGNLSDDAKDALRNAKWYVCTMDFTTYFICEEMGVLWAIQWVVYHTIEIEPIIDDNGRVSGLAVVDKDPDKMGVQQNTIHKLETVTQGYKTSKINSRDFSSIPDPWKKVVSSKAK